MNLKKRILFGGLERPLDISKQEAPMPLRTKFFYGLAFFAVISALILLNFWPIYGPIYDYYQEKGFLKEYLTTCPSDELHLVIFYNKHGQEGLTLNFKTKLLEGGECEPRVDWSFAGKMVSIFSNIRIGDGTPLPGEQIAEVERSLAALPPSKAAESDFASYEKRFHLAFYLGNRLRIYHYEKGEAQSQLEDLSKSLHVGFVTPGNRDN